MEQNDTTDLLNRAKQKDIDAYMQLMSRYGNKVHRRLLQQTGDRNLADAMFQRTMTGFYEMLTKNLDEDAVETLLNFYADSVRRQMVGIPEMQVPPKQASAFQAEEPPKVQNQNKPKETPPEPQAHTDEPESQPTEKREAQQKKKTGNVGITIGIVLLLFGILVVLWVIVGLLMDMNVLPELDLGYTWFYSHIVPLL